MHDVLVIGGGISGLTAAWQLAQAGLEVQVLEAAPVPGGNIRSFDHEGFRLEAGPYAFLGSNDSVWRLVDELGLEPQLERSAPAAARRYIYRDGRLCELPSSLPAFLGTRLLSARAKLRLMCEPFIRSGAQDEDTAWDFFVRRFGAEAASYIMGPFISGIYAGDPRLLGARAAFPKFHDFEKHSGSMIRGAFKYMVAKRRRMRREGIKPRPGLFSCRSGLGGLTAALAERLGARLHCGVAADKLERSEGGYLVTAPQGLWRSRAVVCAVPPPQAAAILAATLPGAIAPLGAIPMAPVTLVHWSQPLDAPVPPGFGFLMPRLYKLRVLGTVFASHIFPGRTPPGQQLLSSYYGGMLDGSAMQLDAAALTRTLLAEHGEIFGRSLAPPVMLRIARYPSAIPQLLPDHPARMARLSAVLLEAPGLFMAGNYLSGVGVDHAVASGFHAADAALAHLGAVPTTLPEAA